MLLSLRNGATSALLAMVLGIGGNASADAMKSTYLSLGDSIAFGYQADDAPSNGDRGFVGYYADGLAAQYGGRPNVVNLGVPGETTESFFTGQGNYLSPNAALMNTNYAAALPQNGRFIQTILSEQAAGNAIRNVTISMGNNDLFALASSSTFQAATPEQQRVMMMSTLGGIQTRYTALLSEIKALAPQAQVAILGSYNPYAALPGSPFAGVADSAVKGLNQVLQAEANAFGAYYVDTYAAFQGNEARFTHILEGGNPHPNDLGYRVIATQVAAVPEPSTWMVVGLALGGAWIYRRRRAA